MDLLEQYKKAEEEYNLRGRVKNLEVYFKQLAVRLQDYIVTD